MLARYRRQRPPDDVFWYSSANADTGLRRFQAGTSFPGAGRHPGDRGPSCHDGSCGRAFGFPPVGNRQWNVGGDDLLRPERLSDHDPAPERTGVQRTCQFEGVLREATDAPRATLLPGPLRSHSPDPWYESARICGTQSGSDAEASIVRLLYERVCGGGKISGVRPGVDAWNRGEVLFRVAVTRLPRALEK